MSASTSMTIHHTFFKIFHQKSNVAADTRGSGSQRTTKDLKIHPQVKLNVCLK